MRLLSSLIVLLAFIFISVRAGGKEGPILRGPFSLSGEPFDKMPFTLHWHPGKNIAALFLRYPTPSSKDSQYAYFAHVWSLDQDRVLVYYKGFNLTFCHDYPIVGDVPARFWHSVENIGSGYCTDGVAVTWYEGKWNPLFVPYGIKKFRLGFDKSEKPVCAEIEPYDYKKDGEEEKQARLSDGNDGSSMGYQNYFARMLGHHQGTKRFTIDYDETPPTMNSLLPRWLQKKCKPSGGLFEEEKNDELIDGEDGFIAPLNYIFEQFN